MYETFGAPPFLIYEIRKSDYTDTKQNKNAILQFDGPLGQSSVNLIPTSNDKFFAFE